MYVKLGCLMFHNTENIKTIENYLLSDIKNGQENENNVHKIRRKYLRPFYFIYFSMFI